VSKANEEKLSATVPRCQELDQLRYFAALRRFAEKVYEEDPETAEEAMINIEIAKEMRKDLSRLGNAVRKLAEEKSLWIPYLREPWPCVSTVWSERWSQR
jgi:hypothetical protein